MIKKILPAIFLVIIFCDAAAQEYTSGNPAAIRAFEQAVHYYDQ
jgi:acid phosphatase family membrane protein YuiD